MKLKYEILSYHTRRISKGFNNIYTKTFKRKNTKKIQNTKLNHVSTGVFKLLALLNNVEHYVRLL